MCPDSLMHPAATCRALVAFAFVACCSLFAACGDDVTQTGAPPVREPEPREAGSGANPVASPSRGMLIESSAEPYDFVLEPEAIDLGVLRPDEDSSCEFFIVNRDTRPLRLVNIDGSCECVAFVWDRGEIPPQGRRRVQTEIRAENRGTKLLTAFVQANDKRVTTRNVTIRYLVQPDLVFTPPRIEFGKRKVGSPATIEAVISYQLPRDASPIDLAPVLRDPQPVTVEVGTAAVAVQPGGLQEIRQSLRLTLEAAAPIAPFETELLFESPRCRPGKLVLRGEVHRGFYLDKDLVQIGIVPQGTTRKAAVRLFWTHEQPRISALESSTPDLTAQAVQEEGSRSYRVEFTYTARSAGDVDAELRILTDLASEPLLLHVRGKVR